MKVTAYDFSIYGGLKARVEQIGADSIATDKGDIYYLIRVRTDETFLNTAPRRCRSSPAWLQTSIS